MHVYTHKTVSKLYKLLWKKSKCEHFVIFWCRTKIFKL